MATFYAPEIVQPTTILSKEESKHCALVLRKRVGDSVQLVNGKGVIANCEISNIENGLVSVQILELNEVQVPYAKFNLVIAPTKQMDRIEWMLEKLCEIGLGNLHLIKTDHSIRKVWKTDRLEKIIHSAIKQSGQVWKANISSYQSVIECLEENSNALHLVMQESGENFKKLDIDLQDEVFVWVGPEGDFSLPELTEFKDRNLNFVRLNYGRLRTETAGFQAINMLHWLCD